MNREQVKTFLPFIQAFAEGKEIQFKEQASAIWKNTECPSFILGCEYRIKPEKKKAWVNIYYNKMCGHYSSKKAADEGAMSGRMACIEIEYEEGEGL